MTEEHKNDEQLQEQSVDASITDTAPSNTVETAAGNTAEDTATDAQREIINQQKSTIDALMQRTEELTKQINTLLSMGVQISDVNNSNTAKEQEKNTLPDDYISLSDLGAQIGKR